jgi:hypothetical protein
MTINNVVLFEKCQDDAVARAHRIFDDNTASASFKVFLAIDLATIVVGWLIAWFLFSIVRWIKRGFAPDQPLVDSTPIAASVDLQW